MDLLETVWIVCSGILRKIIIVSIILYYKMCVVYIYVFIFSNTRLYRGVTLLISNILSILKSYIIANCLESSSWEECAYECSVWEINGWLYLHAARVPAQYEWFQSPSFFRVCSLSIWGAIVLVFQHSESIFKGYANVMSSNSWDQEGSSRSRNICYGGESYYLRCNLELKVLADSDALAQLQSKDTMWRESYKILSMG